MIGIYKITSPSGKIYIGQSIDIKERLRQYKGLRCKKQFKLYRSLLKYGFENHKIEIICECSIDELNAKERYFQEFYNCVDKGLNCILTNTNDKKGVLSEETKKKISEKNKNPSIETRIRKSNGQKGKIVPMEMRKKISESSKGRIVSLETRKKISESGRNISDEKRKRLSDSHKGIKQKEETKIKISQTLKGRTRSEETKLKISAKHGKRVKNTETGEVFLSVAKAAKSINHNVSWLHHKLKGNTKNNTNLIFI